MKEGGRDGGREGGSEGGRDGGREGGSEGGREGQIDTCIYHRTGFKCEHVIIVNCDFSPSVQLLERNVYMCIITHSINLYVARA